MKTYKGRRTPDGTEVTVDQKSLDLRLDLHRHSPSGFEWGYNGSGPAQLSLAILADCVGDDLALQHYQEFKRSVIAALPRERWRLTEDEIRQALESRL